MAYFLRMTKRKNGAATARSTTATMTAARSRI